VICIIIAHAGVVFCIRFNISSSNARRRNIAQKRRIGDVTHISRQADWRSMGSAWMGNHSGEIFHAQPLGEQE